MKKREKEREKEKIDVHRVIRTGASGETEKREEKREEKRRERESDTTRRSAREREVLSLLF